MDDLKLIKKYYGEQMAHLCRELFPSLLETKGLLFGLLKDNFQYSKFLCEDLYGYNLVNAFQEHIYELVDFKPEVKEVETSKDPYELMKEAGYTLYKCETEEDIQRFKKYYREDEELCTFRGGRLNTCDVFFAVKDNAEEIKRENFDKPDREDEYGTSVISIQFGKINHYLSIKNRYNHTVNNPDATFGNNLDNIVPGLSYSFKKYLKYSIKSNYDSFDLYIGLSDCDYVQDKNLKFYYYNNMLDTTTVPIYFCLDNVIIQNGEVLTKFLDKNRYLVFDHYILDLKEKNMVTSFSEGNELAVKDSFPIVINNLGIDKVEVIKTDDGNKEIVFIKENNKIIITINNKNQIIKYYDDINEKIPAYYLTNVSDITKIDLKRVIEIDDHFCTDTEVSYFSAPKLKKAGEWFLTHNELKYLDAPLLEKTGDFSLTNYFGNEINLPNLKLVGNEFFCRVGRIKEICLPNLEYAGDHLLRHNYLEKISLPKLQRIGIRSFEFSPYIQEFYVPSLTYLPRGFLDVLGKKTIKSIYVKYDTLGLDHWKYLIRNYQNLKTFNGINIEELRTDQDISVKRKINYINNNMRFIWMI